MPDTELKTRLANIAEDVAEIRKLLSGGADPSKGLIVRVDRLEQNETRRSWAVKTAIGASIAAVVSAVASIFKFILFH